MMGYIELVQEMENKRGRNHDLNQFRSWLHEKGIRYQDCKMIQVAGTNGKGSTSMWLQKMLQKQGYKVGLFTSPHLVDHRERIRVNDHLISQNDWVDIYTRYATFFEEHAMTMFEIDLWMAIVYFIEKDVDWAIMEVGLGGQRDATTALDYQATLITNIGLDHQEYLGDTIQDVARAKAGIFKKDVPALATEQKEECLEVFQKQAQWVQTSLKIIPKSEFIQYDWKGLPTYQKDNFALALSALETLGFTFTSEQLQSIISDFQWAGRFMVLRKEPLVLLDGAHNVHGVQALMDSLQDFKGHIYFSALKEKDAPKMISMLRTLDCPITLVDFDSYRLYPLEDLALPIISMEQLDHIIKTTQSSILLCGSLYFVGDILKMEDWSLD